MKPSDWEVLFNWGNTLYRQARLCEREGSLVRSFELLQLAADKYLAVLEFAEDCTDALHNWGKVLQCQGSVMKSLGERREAEGPAPPALAALASAQGASGGPQSSLIAVIRSLFHQQIDVYLELYRCVAVNCAPLFPIATVSSTHRLQGHRSSA